MKGEALAPMGRSLDTPDLFTGTTDRQAGKHKPKRRKGGVPLTK